MKDLLEALTLFAKYTEAARPTWCAHDQLYVLVDPAKVTAEDTARLKDLGFSANAFEGHFYSCRFGSA